MAPAPPPTHSPVMVKAIKSDKAVEFGKKYAKSRRIRLKSMAKNKEVDIRKLNVFSAGHRHPLLSHSDDEEWRERVLSLSPSPRRSKEKSEGWLANRRAALVRANATILLNSVADVIEANRHLLAEVTGRQKPVVVVALDTVPGMAERSLKVDVEAHTTVANELSKLVFCDGSPVVVTRMLTVADRPDAQTLSKRRGDNVHILCDRNAIQVSLAQLIDRELEQVIGPKHRVIVKTVLLHQDTWNTTNVLDVVTATYPESTDVVSSRQPGGINGIPGFIKCTCGGFKHVCCTNVE